MFGDCNAPNVENYVYRDFFEKTLDGYRLYRQPGGRDPGAENLEAMGREYYDNSVMTQVKMDRIPWNEWDVDAGFRGYCNKLDFICHDLRSCQAWEEREFEED